MRKSREREVQEWRRRAGLTPAKPAPLDERQPHGYHFTPPVDIDALRREAAEARALMQEQ